MRSCVITGASQGIGRAVAIRMSQEEGVRSFALVARNLDGLKETAAAMSAADKDIHLFPYDLTDLAGIPGLVEEIHERCGGIDLLLNVAGHADPHSILDTTTENMIETYTVNVFAVFVLVRECIKYMKYADSKILNVASTAGMTSRPGWLAYASSKAAIVSMSNTLSDELAEYGIRVYTVSPGRCATNLRQRLAPEEDAGSIMQPEHVAEAIATFMRDTERCLDGQNIIVRRHMLERL